MAILDMAKNTTSMDEKAKPIGAAMDVTPTQKRISGSGKFVEVKHEPSGGKALQQHVTKKSKSLRYRDLKAGVRSQMVRDLERDHIVERSDVRMIIPDRTLDRRISAGEPLKPEEADGIARLVRIVTYARKVFGADDLADEWLRSPNSELDNEVPIRMSAADLGAREVEAVLGRIEHGVFG